MWEHFNRHEPTTKEVVMIGYIDRYHNGVVIRPVFYNGKRYQDHMVRQVLVTPEGEKRTRYHFAAVYVNAGDRYPKAVQRRHGH